MTTAIEEHPAVIEARKALEPIRADRKRLEAERAEAWSLSGRAPVRTDDATLLFPRPEQLVGAQLRLDEIGNDLTRLRLRELPAERALAEAVALARRESLAAINARRRDLVQQLDKALKRAASINAELASADDDAQQVGGMSALRFSWHELTDETPMQQTRLAAWRASCRQHELL